MRKVRLLCLEAIFMLDNRTHTLVSLCVCACVGFCDVYDGTVDAAKSIASVFVVDLSLYWKNKEKNQKLVLSFICCEKVFIATQNSLRFFFFASFGRKILAWYICNKRKTIFAYIKIIWNYLLEDEILANSIDNCIFTNLVRTWIQRLKIVLRTCFGNGPIASILQDYNWFCYFPDLFLSLCLYNNFSFFFSLNRTLFRFPSGNIFISFEIGEMWWCEYWYARVAWIFG